MGDADRESLLRSVKGEDYGYNDKWYKLCDAIRARETVPQWICEYQSVTVHDLVWIINTLKNELRESQLQLRELAKAYTNG